MPRKYKKIDPSEFSNIDDLDKTTVKGTMRQHYAEINTMLRVKKWSAKDVVDWFREREIPMSVEVFRVYLRDLDKENGYKRSTDEYLNSIPLANTVLKVTMQSERKAQVVPKFGNANLVNANSEKQINLEEGQGVRIGDKPKTFEHNPSPDEKDLF